MHALSQAGAFWASAGLLATAFYQLLVKTRQDKLGVNSFQLLHYQAPQSALLVLACTPLFDKVTGPDGFLEVSESGGAAADAEDAHRRPPNTPLPPPHSTTTPWAPPAQSPSPARWPTA